ncbi:MAG: hypothetical protein V2B15_08760 [Bacteroidota bacterium]
MKEKYSFLKEVLHGEFRENRKQRKMIRAAGLKIYISRRKAISKARGLTYINHEVYWVTDEEIGYYVVDLDDIDRLNKNTMKRKGGQKIRPRELDKTCIWRSPKYSTL